MSSPVGDSGTELDGSWVDFSLLAGSGVWSILGLVSGCTGGPGGYRGLSCFRRLVLLNILLEGLVGVLSNLPTGWSFKI